LQTRDTEILLATTFSAMLPACEQQLTAVCFTSGLWLCPS